MERKNRFKHLKFAIFILCMIPIAGILICLAAFGSFLDWAFKKRDQCWKTGDSVV